MKKNVSKGKVFLVGAGPGDPGLITVKGLQILRRVDVVIYDRLSSPLFLHQVRKDCEVISRAGISQQGVNKLLVQKAAEGKMVARLKGGDPFLFGRGAEEVFYLKKNGVDFEVIPGLSSAIAVPEVVGIPLTHRDYSSSLTILTGHEASNKGENSIDWGKVAQSADTIVVLMGVKILPRIVEALIRGGKGEETCAAIIHRGTTSLQRSIITTLGKLPQTVKKERITSPCVVVVGKVVELGKRLNQFSSKSLSGKKILITTPKEKLKALLQIEGAEVVHFPTIFLKPVENNCQLEQVIGGISNYNWIVFTSEAAVDFFWKQLEIKREDSRYLKGLKVAAIGPATATRLKTKGIVADIIPDNYSTQGLLEKLDDFKLEGQSFILPRSSMADSSLGEEIKKRKAKVTELRLYDNDFPSLSSYEVRSVKEQFQRGEINLVTFTSGSTLLNFIKIFEKECLANTKVAAIGPATARIAKKNGIDIDIVANPSTFEGLVQAIKNHYAHI